jgi:hypothetical protein
VSASKVTSRLARRAVLLLPLLIGGCAYADLLSEYDGPDPNHDPIASEVVVVREVQPSSIFPGEVGGFYADRMRYVASGRPHDINRIVNVTGGARHPQLVAINPRVGDTLVISSSYDRTYRAGVHGPVPDWPNGKLEEYPVAFHTLTDVRKASR